MRAPNRRTKHNEIHEYQIKKWQATLFDKSLFIFTCRAVNLVGSVTAWIKIAHPFLERLYGFGKGRRCDVHYWLYIMRRVRFFLFSRRCIQSPYYLLSCVCYAVAVAACRLMTPKRMCEQLHPAVIKWLTSYSPCGAPALCIHILQQCALSGGYDGHLNLRRAATFLRAAKRLNKRCFAGEIFSALLCIIHARAATLRAVVVLKLFELGWLRKWSRREMFVMLFCVSKFLC
jgi:hypothetical protein